MRDKSFFHKGYFSEIFRQLRTAGLISGGILCLFCISSIFASFSPLSVLNIRGIPSAEDMASDFFTYVYVAGMLLTFIAFGWMNKRSSSDFYHSVPVTRAQIYFSSIAAILLWMVIGICAASILTVGGYAVFGLPFNYLLYLCVVTNMLISAVMVVGATGLATAVSGTRFVNIVATLVILFIPRLLIMVFSYFVYMDSDALLSLNNITFLFNPAFNIAGTWPYASLINSITGNAITFTNVPAMIYSFVYSCILVLAGWRLFAVRKSESAGIPTTSHVLQSVFRCAIGMPFILILAFILREDAFSVFSVFLLLALSFIFYCLYELISTRSAKSMVKSMPIFAACIVLGALFIGGPKWVSNYETGIEVNAEDIESYSINNSSDLSSLPFSGLLGIDIFLGDTYRDILINKVEFTDEESKSIIAHAFFETFTSETRNYGEAMNICINRVKGKDLERTVYFTEAEIERLNEIWMTNNDYINAITEYPTGKNYYSIYWLTKEQSKELGMLFEKEMREASKETLLLMQQVNDDDGTIPVYVYGAKGIDNYSDTYFITKYTPKTLKRYMEICNKDAARGIKALNDMLESINNNNVQYSAYVNATICSTKNEADEPMSFNISIESYYHNAQNIEDDPRVDYDKYDKSKISFYRRECLKLLSKGTPTEDVSEFIVIETQAPTRDEYGMIQLESIMFYITLNDEDMTRLIALVMRVQGITDTAEDLNV